MAEVILAKKAGFCFGVDRAIKLIEKLADEGKSVATLGPIIHNQQVIDDLAKRGVIVVESPDEVKDGTILVLRTHGVTREVLHEVEKSGCEFIDAVCPFVKKIHKIVLDNSSDDVVTIIAGDENHPEVKGIKSCAKGESYVIGNDNDVEILLENHPDLSQKPIIFVSQTTFSIKEWKKCIKIILKNLKMLKVVLLLVVEIQQLMLQELLKNS